MVPAPVIRIDSWGWIFSLVMPLKGAGKVPLVGGAARGALKQGGRLKNAVKAKTINEVSKTDGLAMLGQQAMKGTQARKVPESMARSAWLFAGYDDIGKAIKAFNKVLSLEPNHTDASISLSVLYNPINQYFFC